VTVVRSGLLLSSSGSIVRLPLRHFATANVTADSKAIPPTAVATAIISAADDPPDRSDGADPRVSELSPSPQKRGLALRCRTARRLSP
jgi:hypothetical protein